VKGLVEELGGKKSKNQSSDGAEHCIEGCGIENLPEVPGIEDLDEIVKGELEIGQDVLAPAG